MMASSAGLTLFLVAGEHSGDHLGGRLMQAINRAHPGRVRYLGVGGDEMAAHGLTSLFPLSDIAVMGPLEIAKRLPRIVKSVHQTVRAAIAAEPDAVVIIDAPEFTHAVAKRIRRRRPALPIVDYVSPSVWAWRPGRAKRMRGYIDHVMALLPFEPDAHARLGGPPCTYVGHPLIERAEWIRSRDPAALAHRLGVDPARPVVVLLPGSRMSEVTRLIGPFAAALDLVAAASHGIEVVVPTLPAVRPIVEQHLAGRAYRFHVLEGEDDKFAAFRLATAALAASGTVTLELALAGTPMVVGYKVDGVARHLQFLVKTPAFALSNLVLGGMAFPELMQDACTPEALAVALGGILGDTPGREAQLAALARIPERMALPAGTPSEAAAAIVMQYAARR
jgi:lipid-A-disaccharide synthase